MSARVVVLDHAFANVLAEREAATAGGALFEEFDCGDERSAVEAARGASVAVVNFAPVTRPVLESLAPGATVVRYGVGYDNVDIAAAGELGVTVVNVPDYGAETVADHAAAGLLALLRRLPEYHRLIIDGDWAKPTDAGAITGFSRTTVGLVGVGRIGLALAERLSPFGFTVLAHDPYLPAASLEDRGIELVDLPVLLARAEAVSLHVPLTPDTLHIVDADFLARMRPGGILVNTSRGGLVDCEALADAIERQHLAGAALDVTEPEPLPADSRLRSLPGVLLSPHAAFYSTTSLENLQRLAADEITRALQGREPRSPVTTRAPQEVKA
ncbi:C-terminal binding protein [Streptomyces sp. NPDC059477]|uniref:C-terminal binding protein n=1 Tax=Streptomyces sp. NPDC059477 TaxID=3346847 RepID=UPI0036748F0D